MVRDSFNIDYAHHAYSFRPTLCGNCRQWDSKHAEREPVHGRMMAECIDVDYITHWMPLPEPPKE